MNSTNNPKAQAAPRHRKSVAIAAGVIAPLAVVGIAIWSGIIPFHSAERKAAASEPTTAPMLTAKVVRPKKESTVPITIDQIATVEPYFRADLRARASGIVKSVRHDIGEKVDEGETLIEIDVPESVQDVAKAEAIIVQREQELKVSEAKLRDALAAKEVSAATIKQREADVLAATSTRDLRKRKFVRFQQLAAKGSVVGSLVEEEESDYLASEASVASANANVEKARADYAESESMIEGAHADIKLKQAQIEVAKKDLDRAKAVLDYAKIVAPFSGVVVRRGVDPGSFVQNATSGTSEPLISVAKVDVVSVTAKFPDSVAPSIAVGMPALVTVNDLPGVSISAKVTRFAPTVQNADRTMRVEVDLFNGDASDYDRLVQNAKAGIRKLTKGPSDAIPMRAFSEDAPKAQQLISGMIGNIKLTVGSFGNSYVLPSQSIYSRSGASYIMSVQNDETKELPVHVQLNDGKTALVSIVEKQKRQDGVQGEVLIPLNGNEEILVARQLEIGAGTRVKSVNTDW